MTNLIKATGIVRRVDDLGRFVVPIEIRRLYSIGEGDTLEVFVDEHGIVLRKYAPLCIFCGGADKVTWFQNRAVCGACQDSISGRRASG